MKQEDIKKILKRHEKELKIDSYIKDYSYVCFLDVLGFESKKSSYSCIAKKHEDKYIIKIIETISDIVKEYYETENVQNYIKILYISDSIYLFFNDDIEEKIILNIISIIIIYGLQHGMYYRGAIAEETYLSAKHETTGLFVGDGIITSYNFEREVSRYPRIINLSKKFKDKSKCDLDGMIYLNIFKYIEEKYDSKLITILNGTDIKIKVGDECDSCSLQTKNKCSNEIKPKYKTFDDFLVNTIKNIKELIKENDKEKKLYKYKAKYCELLENINTRNENNKRSDCNGYER